MGDMRSGKSKKRQILPAPARQKMILDAALDEFARFGYDECNVDAIAEKAEIGKGTIYRQYPSKLDLYAAVVKRGHDMLHEKMGQIAHCDCGFDEKTRRGIKEFVDFFVTNPKYYRVIFVERPDRRLKLNRMVPHGEEHLAQEIARHITHGVESGEFRAVDPHFAALSFLAIAKVIIERQIYGRGHSLDADTRAAADILKGIHK